MEYNAKENMSSINSRKFFQMSVAAIWKSCDISQDLWSVKVDDILSSCKRFGDFHLNMAGKYFYGL